MNSQYIKLLSDIPHFMKLVLDNDMDAVENLICYKMVNVDKFISDDYLSPCALACEVGLLDMVQLLHKYGASLESNVTVIPPLHAAIRGGNIDIVQWLLDSGVVINSSSGGFFKKRSYVLNAKPLPLALFLEQDEIAQLLISHAGRLDDEISFVPLGVRETSYHTVKASELIKKRGQIKDSHS